MEYWDKPKVASAACGPIVCKAGSRYSEVRRQKAKEGIDYSWAAQGPRGGEATFVGFWWDRAEVSSGPDGALGDDNSGSEDGGCSRQQRHVCSWFRFHVLVSLAVVPDHFTP